MAQPPRYCAYAPLVAPARRSAALWRLGLGLVLLAAISLGLTWVYLMLAARGGMALDPTRLDEPMQVVVFLMSFLGPAAGLAGVLRLLHRRGLASLVGPRPLFARHFRQAGLAALVVVGASLLIPMPADVDLQPNLAPGRWLLWLGPGLVALVVQIGSEELIFRGYVQSQLAARFRSPLVWLVLPALAFGALHWNPAAGANAPVLVLMACAFGVVAGDLTARAGTLGPAVALHLLNNFLALFCVSLPGISGLALYIVPLDVASPLLLDQFAVEAFLLVLLWLSARLAIGR